MQVLRRFRRTVPLVFIAVVLGAWTLGAVPAVAGVSCSFSAGTLDVTLDADADAAVVAVDAGTGDITVDGTPCVGATNVSTDLVRVRDTSLGGSTTLTIDLGEGAFAPGPDEAGTSDEIEFDVDLEDGGADRLLIEGTDAEDAIVLGAGGINLNAGEVDGIDADVAPLAGVEQLEIRANNGNDVVSGEGGAGTGSVATAGSSVEGGSGADRFLSGDGPDAFDGGDGYDVVDYSARATPLAVTIDGVADDGAAAEGDDVQTTVEGVYGGSADDHLVGSEAANELRGGLGIDTIDGMGGDDTIRAGDGDDDIDGGLGYDLIEGGLGNDLEDGGDNSDVFQMSPPTSFRSTDPATQLVDGDTTAFGIEVLPVGQIRDINVRIDLEHGETKELDIVLTSPPPLSVPVAMSLNNGNGTPMRGTSFDSEATQTIKLANDDPTQPYEGRFHPRGSLDSELRGKPAAGIWTLEITDDPGGATGQLNWWQLDINYTTNQRDGNDILYGGDGSLDMADYAARSRPLEITLDGDDGDGQLHEKDNVGAGPGAEVPVDVEDIYSGTNDDVLVGTDVKNDIRGHFGDDEITAFDGNDKLRGGSGDDYIDAGLGWDRTIYGNTGRDTIIAGDGDDRLDGGSQKDTLDGGLGNDECVRGEVEFFCES